MATTTNHDQPAPQAPKLSGDASHRPALSDLGRWLHQAAPTLATIVVLVGCYYGYNASGGPVGVGTATAKSMVLNIVGVHLVGMLGTQLFWGANPRAPIGG